MEFRGRGTQSTGAPASQPLASSSSNAGNTSSSFGKSGSQSGSKLFRLGPIAILFGLTALLIALALFLGVGADKRQAGVLKDKYQAVFLNNGQVYFGKINAIGNKNIDLQNIYYLQTSGGETGQASATTAANVSLVKLGCELHAPYDQMIINSDQVIFWENLQDSSQVVKAITEYKKQNDKQTCSTASQNSTQQAPSSGTTPTTTNPTTTPPAATTPAPARRP